VMTWSMLRETTPINTRTIHAPHPSGPPRLFPYEKLKRNLAKVSGKDFVVPVVLVDFCPVFGEYTVLHSAKHEI
jgi:hypothetical protein